MPSMIAIVHSLCCAAYLAFAGLLLLRSSRAPITIAMTAAAASTALWSGLATLSDFDRVGLLASDIAQTIQWCAWLSVILTVLYRRSRNQNVWLGLALATAGFTALR